MVIMAKNNKETPQSHYKLNDNDKKQYPQKT